MPRVADLRINGQIAELLRDRPDVGDREIARALACSPTTVGKVRHGLGLSTEAVSVQRGGQAYRMKARAGISGFSERPKSGSSDTAPGSRNVGDLPASSAPPSAELQAARARATALCHRLLTGSVEAMKGIADALAGAVRVEAWRERGGPDGAAIANTRFADWIEQPYPAGLGASVGSILAMVDRFADYGQPESAALIRAALQDPPSIGERRTRPPGRLDGEPHMPAKPATKTEAPAKRPNPIATRTLTPSPALAAVVGKGKMPRTEVISKVWEHIRKHNLQNPANKREILADEKLKAVFGRDSATMFELSGLLSPHLH